VDSLPEALIHKERIAIQIQPSGRQSAWFRRAFNRYGNCVFNFNLPDACLSWSGRALNRYGNCVLKISHLDVSPLVQTREALYGNYLQRTSDRPDDSASPSGLGSQTRKILAKISKFSIPQLSVRTAQVHRPDGVRTYHSSCPFEPSAYK
jgi:hypothetical protein